jgi:hypothetical protein
MAYGRASPEGSIVQESRKKKYALLLELRIARKMNLRERFVTPLLI